MSVPAMAECVGAIQQATSATEFIEAVTVANAGVCHSPSSSLRAAYRSIDDARYPHVFPHPDVLALGLTTAFEQTHELGDTNTTAFTLGVAVAEFHPFYDGNGRVSRLTHAALLGFNETKIAGMGIASYHPSDAADGKARHLIDLKPPENLRSICRETAYRRTGMGGSTCRAYTQTSVSDEQLLRHLLKELPGSVNRELATILRPGWNGQYFFPDRDSLTYALTAASLAGLPLRMHPKADSGLHGVFFVNMAETISVLEMDELRVLLDAAWDFRYQRAMAVVECTLPGELGEQRVQLRTGERPTARECFRRYTNNLLSQTVTND